MAINYEKVKWNETPYKYANPENMNKMDTGIKSACDGIDSLNALELDGRLKANGYGESSGGRNIWDEKWTNGYWDTTSGAFVSNSRYVCNGEKIKVSANTRYAMVCNTTSGAFFYDANGSYLSYSSVAINGTFTTPSNCAYLNFNVSSSYGTTYNHDIAIIEGTSGSYEPYYESNKMLTEDVNEIASLKYLGWTVPREMPIKNVSKTNGMTQRVGRVDLGSLSWSAVDFGGSVWAADFSSTPKPSYGGVPSIYCNKYTTCGSSGANLTSGGITIAYTTGNIFIRDTSFTDATQFRNSLQGTYLYYELSSPVEFGEGSEITFSTQTVAATLASGFTGGYVSCTKVGSVVSVCITNIIPSSNITTDTVMATLPFKVKNIVRGNVLNLAGQTLAIWCRDNILYLSGINTPQSGSQIYGGIIYITI